MPTVSDHRSSAERNYKFSQALLNDDSIYTEWVVISLFYSLVHYLEAYLASLPVPVHPGNHSERDAAVSQHLSRDCFKKYMLIKDKSIDARYYCVTISKEYVRSKLLPSYNTLKDVLTERI